MEGDGSQGQHTIEVPCKSMKELVSLLSQFKPTDDDMDTIEVHQRALDDLVSVNSLFTIAVFVGLSFASPRENSLESRPECIADPVVSKRLILNEVISFACFLLSSLVAKTIKVQLEIYRYNEFKDLGLRVFRGFMLSLTVTASFLGIVFLTLSITNVIQIRLGKLSCGSSYALEAVASLCAIVLVTLTVYLPSTVNVIWVSMQHVYRKKI